MALMQKIFAWSRPRFTVSRLTQLCGGADAAVEAGVQVGWSGFRQLMPLLISKVISLVMRWRLCVGGGLMHGGGAQSVGEENGVALRWAETGVVGWVCGIGVKDGVPGGKLRGRVGLNGIVSVMQ